MGRRGRPPLPSNIHKLRGNPGKRPLNANEPRPEPGAPPCPSWLPAEAKKEWKKIVKVLTPLGLVTKADGATLAALCLAVAELRAATETIEQHGRYVTTENGFVLMHPAVKLQRSAWEAVKKFSQLFGLDPSSRSRLSVPLPEGTPDEFEAFLSGAPGAN